jgi:hypothetical protein
MECRETKKRRVKLPAVDFDRVYLLPFIVTKAAKPTCKWAGRTRKIGVETVVL